MTESGLRHSGSDHPNLALDRRYCSIFVIYRRIFHKIM